MAAGDNVVILGGSGDTVNISSGTLLTVAGITNTVLNGSNDTVGLGANNSINVAGSNDAVLSNGNTGDTVGLVSGSGDTVNISSGTLLTVAGITNTVLNGSNDTVGLGANNSINVAGSNDAVLSNGNTGDTVGLVSGSGDTVNISSGTLLTVAGITNTVLNGSNDTVGLGANNSINVAGSNDAVLSNGNTGDTVGLVSGSGDTVNISSGTLLTVAGITNTVLNGSNDTVGLGANNSINVAGSNDAVLSNGNTGDTVGLVSGSGDTVNISSGTLLTVAGITNTVLNGSNDTVGLGANNSINVAGSNDAVLSNGNTGDTVGLVSGSGDTVNISSGTLLTVAGITNTVLNGSNDTVGLGANNSINVAGSNDAVLSNGNTGDTVGLVSGSGDTVNISSGTLLTVAGITNTVLNGSNDTVGLGANNSINVAGSNDAVLSNGNTGDTVGLVSGSGDTVNISSGTLLTVAGITNTVLNGSNDTVGLGANNSINVAGSNDAVLSNGNTGDTVGLVSGSGDTVNISSGTLLTVAGITNTVLNGSNDTVGLGANNSINVAGSNDAVLSNGNTGDTVGLVSGSGDTIDINSGTIVAANGTTGITVNGSGDQVIAEGPVNYSGGNIANIISYFEVNPNLSENEITLAESNSNYQNNLATYLTSANISALPSNVLSMLDGYSSLYLAVLGIPTSAFTNLDYIEQQFNWAERNYPIPTDGLQAVLQNLMPALLDTNATTKNLIFQAVTLLQQGNAAAPQGNQGPMLDDTAAKLLLQIAEEPDNAKQASAGDSVYTPGRTGHWDVAVTSSGSFSFQYKSPPLIDQILGFVNSYLTPVVDILAISTGQPELVFTASALSLVQAGQNFAVGDDLSGVFNVVGAIGGALGEIGKLEGISGKELSLIGATLSQGVSTAQGVDGIAVGAQEGQILTAIASGLGGLSNIAPLADERQFLAIGSALAATGVAVSGGDVLAAIGALTTAAANGGLFSTASDPYSTPASLQQDVAAILAGYQSAQYDEVNLGVQYADNGTVKNDAGNNTSIISFNGPGIPTAGDDPGSPDPNLTGIAAEMNDFFYVQEGGNYKNGYVPLSAPAVYSTTSGVTVGEGVDLSEQNAIGLAMEGVPQNIIQQLTPYLGTGNSIGTTVIKGSIGITAENLLIKNNGLTFLSSNQVSTLNYYVQTNNLIQTEIQWNDTNDFAPVLTWDQLPGAVQTALAWMKLNGSLGMGTNFWDQVTSGQWLPAVKNLNYWHLTSSGIPIHDQPTSPFLAVGQLILNAYDAPGSILPGAH